MDQLRQGLHYANNPTTHAVLFELACLTVTPALVTLAWIIFIQMKTTFAALGMALTTAAMTVLRVKYQPTDMSTKALIARFIVASSLTSLAVKICGASTLLEGPTNPLADHRGRTDSGGGSSSNSHGKWSWHSSSSTKVPSHHNHRHDSMVLCYFGVLGVIATVRSFDYLIALLNRFDMQNITNLLKPNNNNGQTNSEPNVVIPGTFNFTNN